MDTQCEQCHAHSTLKCSKCNANYCSVTCQHAAWPTHKVKCSRRTILPVPSNLPYRALTDTDTDRVLRKIVDNVRRRIEGNLQLMVSYHPDTSSMRVIIDERVESMLSDFHWAHISCRCDGTAQQTVPVMFVFIDVSLTCQLIRDNASIVGAQPRIPDPGLEWSVMFEM